MITNPEEDTPLIIATNIQKDSSPTIVECRPQKRIISSETKERYLEFLKHGKLNERETMSHIPRLRSVLQDYLETEADRKKKQTNKPKSAEPKRPARKSERLVSLQMPSTSKKRTSTSPTESELDNDDELNNYLEQTGRKKPGKKAGSELTSKKRKGDSFIDNHKINYKFKWMKS